MKPLILDNALFPSLAARLARDMEVAYFSSWNSAYPTSREFAPATGLENVERVDDPITYMLDGKASHVLVPDLYLNGLETLARRMELPVSGCNGGNKLEVDRTFLMEWLVDAGFPVIETVEITGIDALAQYLEKHDDKYIKVSTYRGDMESWHHWNWEKSRPKVDRLRYRLGPLGNMIRFVVQDPIDSVCEVGIDTYFFGKWLWPAILGWEIKDVGYAGYLLEECPPHFQPLMDALATYFKQHDYRWFFSNEMRITKEGAIYMTDATCRMPSPPSGVMMAACENFADVALKGEAPDYKQARYFCEIILTSTDVIKDYLQVDFPTKFKDRYAFHNFCEIGGKTWILPNEQWSDADPPYVEFGSALGWGPTLDEASQMAEEAAEAVKGSHVSFGGNVLEKAKMEMEKYEGLIGS